MTVCEILWEYGMVLSCEMECEKAISVYTDALGFCTNDYLVAHIYWSRSLAYSRSKQFTEALLDINKAMSLNSGEENLMLFDRESIYRNIGNIDLADSDLCKINLIFNKSL